ncbi:YEATS domain containing 2 homolog D12 [Arctopsyche grandis]|uniref:YEATS domain containing 2 homolog D12 n=1 Tax=Arctopsyche grandis TaxID=121162 RepID=UPI00406D83DA
MSDRKCEFDEFRDPDYIVTVKIEKDDTEPSPERRSEKIKTVVKREFQNEIENKQESLLIIDERLLEARKLFHRLRYAIVNSFYNSKKFELTDDDIKKEVSFQTDPVAKSEIHSLLTNDQKRIHPAVKDILSEKSTDDMLDLLAQRPLRKRFKHDISGQHVTIAMDSNVESLRPSNAEPNGINTFDLTIKQERLSSSDNDVVKCELKKPMYVEPKGLDNNVLKIDSSNRNKQKQKFRIIIGNTSKYIEPHSAQERITHRWLLYVRGPQSDPDISHILDYVTVQLHDSYIPHNIIKIKSHPFHLSRRGWGEFPVKLRLHFKNEKLNKPVNLLHNLKLDRLHTGLQTLGGETVVDVWLYTDESMLSKIGSESEKSTEEYQKNGTPYKTIDRPSDEGALTMDIKTEGFDDCIKIKDEPMDVDDDYEDGVFNDDEMLEFDPNNYDSKTCDTLYSDRDLLALSSNNFVLKNLSNVRCDESNSNSVDTISLVSIKNNAYSNPDVKLLKDIYNDHCYCNGTSYSVDLLDASKASSVEANTMLELNRTIGFDQIIHWYNNFNLGYALDDDITLGIDRIIELNKVVVEKVSNIKVKSADLKLNLKNITVLNKVIVSFYMKELSSIVWSGGKGSPDDVVGIVNVLRDVHSFNEMFVSLKVAKSSAVGKVISSIESMVQDMSKIRDVRCFVNMMMKRMPIVDKSARSTEFQQLFPYAVESVDKFFSLHLIKRRNLQWTRAKMIHEFMKKCFNTNAPSSIWTTKQILIFGQYHGYFPVREADASNPSNDDVHILNGDIKTDEEKVELKETFRNSLEINTKTVYSDFESSSHRVKNDPADQAHVRSNNTPSNDFCYISDSSDDEIDICDEPDTLNTSPENKKSNKIPKTVYDMLPIENSDDKILCQYIEQTCSKLGIVLRNQNIGHNYVCGLVHKLILSAAKSFIEDVVRRSLAVKTTSSKTVNDVKESVAMLDPSHPGAEVVPEHSAEDSKENVADESASCSVPIVGGKIWKSSESNNVSDISLRHIFEALKSRKEFDLVTNFGLGQESSHYTGQL